MSKELIERAQNSFADDAADRVLISDMADRIEELERRLEKAFAILGADTQIDAEANFVALRQELDALQADNARLREALEDGFNKISQMCFEGEWTGIETTIDKIRKTLAATHEQSLARYHNEVLEKAAKKADAFDAFTAMQIRAMKEPE